MGTVYYLAREDNYTLFDLGKAYGYAHEFRKRHGEATATSGQAAVIFAELDGRYPHHAQIATHLHDFADGKPLRLLDDNFLCDDSGELYREGDRDLRIIDSVFEGDWKARPPGVPLWKHWKETREWE